MHEQATFKAESGAIHCEGCEKRIATALRALPGITGVQASATTQEITVRFDPAQSSADQVAAKLTDIGFPATRASR